MKVTIKTLQQKVFQIDAEGSDTVGDLKTKIQESQGHGVESQKLIFAGKVLTDEKSIESCHIKEKDFLVLMVSKPKPTPAASSSAAAAPAPAPATPAAVTPAAAPAAPAPAAAEPPNAPVLTPAQPAAPAAAGAPAAEPAQPVSSEEAFVRGEQFQTTITNLMALGFEHDQVVRALRASFHNPDRAAEYLFNGIPAHLQEIANGGAPAAGAGAATATAAAAGGAAAPAQPATAPTHVTELPPAQPAQAQPRAAQPQNLFQLAAQQQQAAQQPHGGRGGLALPTGAGGAGGAVDPAAMPDLGMLRQILQEDPGAMQELLQQFAQTHPEEMQQLAQNPELINQLLAGLPHTVVELTQDEEAAIQRLMSLGFSRDVAIEAYLACDKNEELAANYLFEGGFEDE